MKKVHKIEKSFKQKNESEVENSEIVVKDSIEEVQDLTKSAIKVEQCQENDEVDPFQWITETWNRNSSKEMKIEEQFAE